MPPESIGSTLELMKKGKHSQNISNMSNAKLLAIENSQELDINFDETHKASPSERNNQTRTEEKGGLIK